MSSLKIHSLSVIAYFERLGKQYTGACGLPGEPYWRVDSSRAILEVCMLTDQTNIAAFAEQQITGSLHLK